MTLAPDDSGRQRRSYALRQRTHAAKPGAPGIEGPPEHARLDVRLELILQLDGLRITKAPYGVEGPEQILRFGSGRDDLLEIVPVHRARDVGGEGRLS